MSIESGCMLPQCRPRTRPTHTSEHSKIKSQASWWFFFYSIHWWLQKLNLTWGIVLSDLHIVSSASWSCLQVQAVIAEGEVVSCRPLQVPFTVGAVGIVGSWEARAVDRTALTYVGTSTCCCVELQMQNKGRAISVCRSTFSLFGPNQLHVRIL